MGVFCSEFLNPALQRVLAEGRSGFSQSIADGFLLCAFCVFDFAAFAWKKSFHAKAAKRLDAKAAKNRLSAKEVSEVKNRFMPQPGVPRVWHKAVFCVS